MAAGRQQHHCPSFPAFVPRAPGPRPAQDLPRTYPKNKWIAHPEGQQALKCVLMAYSAHNKHIGYCQSMNYVAAMLLLGLDKNEENAFWLLATLIEDLLYPNTYSSQLTGCHVEMRCATGAWGGWSATAALEAWSAWNVHAAGSARLPGLRCLRGSSCLTLATRHWPPPQVALEADRGEAAARAQAPHQGGRASAAAATGLRKPLFRCTPRAGMHQASLAAAWALAPLAPCRPWHRHRHQPLQRATTQPSQPPATHRPAAAPPSQVGCDTSMLATDWFLCLFATSMPGETVARVWDALLYEGPKVIYRVALAALKMHQSLVLKKDNAGGWALGALGAGCMGEGAGAGAALAALPQGAGSAAACPGAEQAQQRRVACSPPHHTTTLHNTTQHNTTHQHMPPTHTHAHTHTHPAGDILKVVKDATQRLHDREALVRCAFQEIGSLKMGTIKGLRSQHQVGGAAWLAGWLGLGVPAAGAVRPLLLRVQLWRGGAPGWQGARQQLPGSRCWAAGAGHVRVQGLAGPPRAGRAPRQAAGRWPS
jgi:hypothetical protein